MERRDIIERYGFARKKRWRRFRSLYLVALVAAGVEFPDIKTRILPDLPPDSFVGLQVGSALEPAIHNIWQYLEEGRTAINAWLTIPSAWTAETMAHIGFDASTIDMQHGLADYQTTLSMLQAISTTDAVPLARVPWNEPVTIMRLLDAGIYGLVCPMVNSREEAEAFVGACRYPPMGFRSYGPIRANVYAGDDYFENANQTVITLAMIETAQALENLEEIVTTPGLDGVYVGTVDLSISMGLAGLGNLNDPKLQNALNSIVTQIVKHNRIAGIHVSTPENATKLSEQGFRLITPVNDTILLRSAAKNVLEQTRKSVA